MHTLGLVLFGILLFVLYLLAFNWYLGQGKEARYVSYRQFVIDGISYRLIEPF